MMRAIGFLSGVALTVAALLLVLDTRESQQAHTVAQATDDAAEELSAVFEAIAGQVDVLQLEIEPDQVVPRDQESATADPGAPSGSQSSGLDQAQQPSVQALAQGDASDPDDGTAAGTYLFWSPFRSAWAAQGFARRLSSATQVPVEVVNAGPSAYRVAFGYRDESERLARIERIETITGLQLE